MLAELAKTSACVLALGGALLWLRSGDGAAPPVASVDATEAAPPKPAPITAPAVAPQPSPPAAAVPPLPEPKARTTARVRVIVRLPDGACTAALPIPELHRLGPGRPPVARDAPAEPSLRSLATQPAVERRGAAAEASSTFEVDRPGRYAAAWHLWVQVPGSRTWRVQRGLGPEITVSEHQDQREVVVYVGSDDLASDPSLDTRAPGAQYHFTPKDGD